MLALVTVIALVEARVGVLNELSVLVATVAAAAEEVSVKVAAATSTAWPVVVQAATDWLPDERRRPNTSVFPVASKVAAVVPAVAMPIALVPER